MAKFNIEERIQFLIDSYNVYDTQSINELENILNKENYQEVQFLTRDGYKKVIVGNNEIKLSKDNNSSDLIVSVNNLSENNGINGSNKLTIIKKSVLGVLGLKDYYEKKFVFDTRDFYISDEIFSNMLEADPSNNKMYTQWMLNVFARYSRKYEETNPIVKAIQFSTEDLSMAKEYLILFEKHKRKQKFFNLCQASPLLKNIKDVTNINQYKSLSELYDAVDPFIERNVSGLLKDMKRYVDSGQALMPIRDRNYTLFIPLTRDANVLFNKLASWCTATPGNGMFKSYVGKKTPNNEDSKIYIIIDNKVFEGESDKVWQVHFESQQYKDKSNGSNVDMYEDVLSKSETLFMYFKEEITKLAKAFGGDIDKNSYVKIASSFGIIDTLFDMLPQDAPQITIKSMKIKKMGDVSKFKKLQYLTMINCGIDEIHPSIGNLKKLGVCSLFGNNLKTLPSEISKCKNLSILTLSENPLEDIPDSIAELDTSNGGSLLVVSYSPNRMKKAAVEKLKKLLPNVNLQEQD